MSRAFRGIENIRAVAALASKNTDCALTVRTVSCEPTSYAPGQFHIDRPGFERTLIRLFDAYASDRDNSWREYGVDFENDTFHVHVDYQHFDCRCSYEVDEKSWLTLHPHSAGCFNTFISPSVKEIEDTLAVPEFNWFRSSGKAFHSRMAQMLGSGSGPTEQELQQEREDDAAYEIQRAAYLKASDKRNKAIEKAVLRLAEEFGISSSGSVTLKADNAHWLWQHICTCGSEEDHRAWQQSHDHIKPCEYWWAGQPNFLHKPSGYSLNWYKCPCREAYGNQEMSTRKFRVIIRECIQSARGRLQAPPPPPPNEKYKKGG